MSTCAVVNTGAGQALFFGQEVTYDCQLGCHVGSNWSRKSFSRRCQKDGLFDGDLDRQRYALCLLRSTRRIWVEQDDDGQTSGRAWDDKTVIDGQLLPDATRHVYTKTKSADWMVQYFLDES